MGNRMKHTDLPLTSTHWGAYRVETKDGTVKALHSFEEDNDSSPIGNGIIDVLAGSSRIKTPMIRESWLKHGPGTDNHKRGADPFVSVSWNTAERLVANELNRVRNDFGNNAIYAGSYGWASAGRFHHAQSQVHRFLNCIGGYTRSVNTYSLASAEVILPHILGPLFPLLAESTSWPSVIENTDLLVAFGGIPLKNGQINAGGVGRHVQKEHLLEAAEAGVEFINISPVRSDIDDFARTEWLAPRPSTDAALLIAIAQILHAEGLVDTNFVARYTHGYEEFIPYLTGEKDGVVKDAAWAAEITGLSAETIQSLALRMFKGRTMLSLSWSLTRQHHGEQAYWAGVTVAAMLGQIGLPGGGITFGYSATNSIGDNNIKIPGASLPQGKNQVADFIPVARISDLLLNSGGDFDFNGKRYQYPDTHLVYWAGGNPFHHHQDINRMLKAWQKPDTIIVNEWCWNSMAKHADIVLPCTTNFERNDIAISPRDSYMVNMQQVIEPIGESRNDYDIFAGIAKKMGLEAEFTEGRDEAQWLDWIYNTTRENAQKRSIEMPEYQEFKVRGWFKPADPTTPLVMLKAFREDPESNALATATGKIEIYSPTVASFGYDDCPGHATWIEPLEWLGGDTSAYPLHLISNQPAKKLHSQLDHGSQSRSAKIAGREPITLHPKDAAARGLEAGQVVRVFNGRGACLAAVVISDEVMQGAVQMSTGAWYDPVEPGQIGSLCKHGSVNVLTPDVPTSKLGQGPIAHTCMVEIERFEGELPEVTAFDPPVIIEQR